jgi:pentalenolactone synthase
VTDVPNWPFERTDILDIAPAFRALRRDGPVTRVRNPDGELAWLVTGHPEVRALYADPRLSWAHPDPGSSAPTVVFVPSGGGSGGRVPPLTHSFSYQRMRALRPHIERIVADLLDDMARHGPPIDFHESVSFPLPAQVICEILGVPYADRERFRAWSTAAANWVDRAAAAAAIREFTEYLRHLVELRRAEPAPDVITDLVDAARENRMREEEIPLAVIGLLFAGHQTTTTRIDLGTLLFLTNPGQRARLAADPELLGTAVEEVLRVSSPNGGGGLPRYAHTEITGGDATIHTGDQVLLAASVANRDERVFPAADDFDIGRVPNPHLAFGYGPHFCCGAAVARLELRALFGALFARFPGLRLAVPVEEVPVQAGQVFGGVTGLPLTW